MVSDYHLFHSTCAGAAHIVNGIVCQDYSMTLERKDCCAAVVCDGHGGEDYFRSDRGSRLAAQAFMYCMENPDLLSALSCAADEKQQAMRIQQLINSVITRWNALVEQDIANDPFADSELDSVSEKYRIRYESGQHTQSAYGTTLIAAVISNDFWFAIQIGDGKCVAVSREGNFYQPIPWDDRCFLNVTTSICDSDAAARFRYYFSRELPTAVFLGSDGIDDCFANDDKLYGFYRVALSSFSQMDYESACGELIKYLPELSRQGSRDDMSVAAIIDIDFIHDNPGCFERPRRAFLSITRDGDYGGDSPRESYFEQAEIEALPGVYDLSVLNCGGFGQGFSDFEILSADKEQINVRVGDETCVLTPENDTAELVKKSRENSYDGPWWISQDALEFKMILK